MTLGLGRVLPAESAASAVVVNAGPRPPGPSAPARVVKKPIVDAQARAARIIVDAESLAARLLEQGRAALGTLHAQVTEEARAEGSAALAARLIALRAREERADERALVRTTELARLLAERLLGEALALDPARVVALARRALSEARGARRICVVAHPEDAPLLERALAEGSAERVVEVLADPARARGSLRFETEIGSLDADVAPQLDRLTARLREALRDEQ